MWFFSKELSGHVELWDAPLVYFITLFLSGIIARYSYISCFLGCALGQYVGLIAVVGNTKFLPVGITFIVVSSVLSSIFSFAMSKTFYKTTN